VTAGRRVAVGEREIQVVMAYDLARQVDDGWRTIAQVARVLRTHPAVVAAAMARLMRAGWLEGARHTPPGPRWYRVARPVVVVVADPGGAHARRWWHSCQVWGQGCVLGQEFDICHCGAIRAPYGQWAGKGMRKRI
jgi:hypothetical protein